MKICLVTDTHFGARNDTAALADYFEKFYKNTFFPYIDEHNIDTIIHLGDTFDRRKYINFLSLEKAKKMFFQPIADRNLKFHIIVGNHDAYYKNTIKLNSIDLLTKEYPNIVVHNEPQVAVFDGVPIVMLPWVCADNQEQSFTFCENTSAQILFGHLELQGYQMYKGKSVNYGMADDWLSKFDVVCTGHYHTKSTTKNINYLGCPYEITWADYGDEKGFHVFDTETRGLTFIPNPYKIFHKIHYDDANKTMEEVVNQDVSHVGHSYVKVIVREKTNPYWFDMLIGNIEKMNPVDIQIVEDHFHADEITENEIIDEAEDTMTILQQYINNLEVNVDKNKLERVVETLYNEALQVE